MRSRIGSRMKRMIGGIALVMLGFLVGRSSVGSPVVETRSEVAASPVYQRQWLPLAWNGYRKAVVYEHMYVSRARRR